MTIHDLLNPKSPVPRSGEIKHGNPPGTRTPEMLYVGNIRKVRDLKAATCAKDNTYEEWKGTYRRLAEHLAAEYLGDMVALSRGLAPESVPEDYRLKTDDDILVVALSNGFDAAKTVGSTFSNSFPAAHIRFLKKGCPEEINRADLEGWHTVVFVEIGPDNCGGVTDECIRRVHDMELPVGIVAVVGAAGLSYLRSGVSQPILRYDERVLILAF